jgi:hypothetical protein
LAAGCRTFGTPSPLRKAAEIEFLLTDLDAGFAFLDPARLTRDDVARKRCMRLAREAHDTVADFANRPTLSGSDLTHVREGLAKLKAALQLQGEEFPAARNSAGT